MDKQPKILEMELHEVTYAGAFEVMRVSGGWLYSNSVGTTFVQYNNEFYRKSDELL